ncbi:uncharacterized protein LOC108036060 [Drosophila biarmipes]|uniref:uncharacterized protein LOC108036060 n=1 Tax=Drosophila biarmipes TaxID=125945 RepID=UPI0007E7F5CD|nr:uncharacterized protein LOC108036060 [Drosophila biarmipes]
MHSLWFLLVLLAVVGSRPGVSALRCYKCEDCDEYTLLSDMEVCEGPLVSGNGQGTPASSSPSPAPAPAPSPAASPAPNPPGNVPAPSENSEEEEDYESEESESATVGIMPAGNGAAAGTGTGNGAAGGAAQEPVREEEEEEDEDEEEDERRRRRSSARQVDLDMPIAFCYTVRLQLNESVITNRGCTTARMSNQTVGCEGIFENWTVGGCQLCQDDGCNQPIGVSKSSRSLEHSGTLVTLTLMAFMTRCLV